MQSFIKNKNLIRINLIKNFRIAQKKTMYKKFQEYFFKLKQKKESNLKFKEENLENSLFFDNYYFLMQCLIKKGQKENLEKTFKKSLLFWIKNISNKNFLEVLKKAFQYTIVHVGVFTKRKGSKNIYIPYKLPVKKSRFFAIKWILANAFAKKKRKFFEGILDEIQECSLKTSSTLKKREELLKLAEENLNNLKKKRKF